MEQAPPSAAAEQHRRIKEKLERELGPDIVRLLSEPDVTEIMLNPDGRVWIDRISLGMEQVGTMKAHQALSLIGTVASTLNSAVTRESPTLECELPLDGSRFAALVPPVVSAPVFTIRRKAVKIFTLGDYVAAKIMTERQCEAICDAVRNYQNILVVGGTGSGKTTLTNAIIDYTAKICPDDRIVIIEDTAEIQCSSPNNVILRATDTVDMLRLLKATMRLFPKRITVGEVRGGEALALLKAWNTGHPGGVATAHANGAYAGLVRLESLVGEATAKPMQSLIAEAVNYVVAISKTPAGRRVQSVLKVTGFQDGVYQTINLED